MRISIEELAGMIDHTNVQRDATDEDIKVLCQEADDYNFSCVCVTPTQAALSRELLENSDTQVCVVIGFPFGVQTPQAKAFEAEEAVENGASELDMVMNIGALKSSHHSLVQADIAGVVGAAKGRVVKVILETALLTHDEKITACQLAREAGAHYVKTSTGFGVDGATVEDVRLMRDTVGLEMGVKAAGGIRNLETALAMIDAGASKIGTSTGVQIMEDLLDQGDSTE
ncbi:MAG: deoxyribose-phosphate aldolase [Euryarchaeota archaeon]|jgi:deoxyribose-phosphate aldolase|uniref:deoxyribose-phosphate aldolase n=1 Tax=Methanobacterium sp. MZD130B TaxID=3394378 RepID=UPI00175DFC42|nr:deoxyribose-phosphate aldolase [Euryarchaeota archaeon]HHT18665.1 deoxyribose-phosphate aldolase [Methanobacterium sp.]